MLGLTIWAVKLDRTQVIENSRSQAQAAQRLVATEFGLEHDRLMDQWRSWAESFMPDDPAWDEPHRKPVMVEFSGDILVAPRAMLAVPVPRVSVRAGVIEPENQSVDPAGTKDSEAHRAADADIQNQFCADMDRARGEFSASGAYMADILCLRFLEEAPGSTGLPVLEKIVTHLEGYPSFLSRHIMELLPCSESLPSADVVRQYVKTRHEIRSGLRMAMDGGSTPQEFKPLTSVAVETSGGPVSFTLFPVADASPEERRIFLAVASDMYFSAVGEIGAQISRTLGGLFSVEPLFHESVVRQPEEKSGQGDQLILASADVSESSWIPPGWVQVILIPSSMERLYLEHHRRVWVLGLVVFYVLAAGLWTVRLLYRNQKTMAALNAMQTNFVSSVSHELRAPIGALQLLSESLEKERIHDEDKKRDYYRMMNRECRRLGALVSNILSFSRANQTTDAERFSSFPPRSVAGECVKLMQPLARETNRDIELKIDDPIPESVRMDPNAIRQALINLLDNAIKYTPAGTTVSLHVSCAQQPDHNSINFSIFDHGPGIRIEDQSRVFEPFFRSGSELTRETQGVGIGLSIVSHIAGQHGGAVRFENLQSGGCAFHLSIPVEVESVEGSEP